jgi:hypothetical protein
MLSDMSKPIPPAKLEHMLMVNHTKSRQPELDLGQAVRAAIGSTVTREEMLSVASRLLALSNIRAHPELRPWLVESGKDQSTGDVAILKAAARAPLLQTQFPADLAFDLNTFKAILLEEGRP